LNLRLPAISIHAPERGATGSSPDNDGKYTISIHAPERGATLTAKGIMGLTDISIHAPERGATCRRLYKKIQSEFQSTLPNGERHQSLQPFYILTAISIHAPERGATIPVKSLYQPEPISIHAPERGATPSIVVILLIFDHFNPRSRTGSDHHYDRHTGQ